ncbi:hypothetical protein JHK82_044427 [Glycine max]|nr:hypothetical protein JHK82_044427 [Glycine max]
MGAKEEYGVGVVVASRKRWREGKGKRREEERRGSDARRRGTYAKRWGGAGVQVDLEEEASDGDRHRRREEGGGDHAPLVATSKHRDLEGYLLDDNGVHLVMELYEGEELFNRIVVRCHYIERVAAAVTKTIVKVVHVRSAALICGFFSLLDLNLREKTEN